MKRYPFDLDNVGYAIMLDEGEFVCKDCPACKGSGLFKNIFDLYAVKCPICKGKGVIRVA